jgi:hypothetical protein
MKGSSSTSRFRWQGLHQPRADCPMKSAAPRRKAEKMGQEETTFGGHFAFVCGARNQRYLHLVQARLA